MSVFNDLLGLIFGVDVFEYKMDKCSPLNFKPLSKNAIIQFCELYTMQCDCTILEWFREDLDQVFAIDSTQQFESYTTSQLAD